MLDYEERGFVDAVDGVPLFYGATGPRDADLTVILNDGIGCDGFAWRYLQPELAAQKYRVVHWNYRGHGRSGAPAGYGPSGRAMQRDVTHRTGEPRLTLPHLAEDLLRVMDHLEIERALLVGHSMGTQVQLETYRLAKDRVLGLVLMCGSYGRVTKTFRGNDMLDRVLPGVLRAVQSNAGLARGMWSRISPNVAYKIATASGEVDKRFFGWEDFRRYWEHIGIMDPDLFLTLLRAAGQHSAEDLLPVVDTPSLVIAAENDTFTPKDLAEHMAVTIPRAEHFVLRGASHAAPVEHPLAIQLRIEKFLRERI